MCKFIWISSIKVLYRIRIGEVFELKSTSKEFGDNLRESTSNHDYDAPSEISEHNEILPNEASAKIEITEPKDNVSATSTTSKSLLVLDNDTVQLIPTPDTVNKGSTLWF